MNCSEASMSQDENEAVSGPMLWFQACRLKRDVLPEQSQSIHSQSFLFVFVQTALDF